MKAKIFKRAGDQVQASQLYNEARKMDLADRYLNAVSSRYMIRIDQVQEAEKTMSLFSKEGEGEGLNVHDMQCMWYESEVGNSYLRQHNYRLALKNFNWIEKHFDQIHEDQFDFHLYSMRKYTLQAYFEMIEMEDHIYQNKFAVKAAVGIINTMMKLESIKDEELEKVKPEFEKYKESKEYKKLQEELKKQDDDEFKMDSDPMGYELYIKTLADPIAKAVDIATLITKYNPQSKDLHAKAITVFLKKSKSSVLINSLDKLLLALKSLVTLVEHHPTYEKTITSKIKFFRQWMTMTEADKKAAIKDEKLYNVTVDEVKKLGCPATLAEVDALEGKMPKDTLESALEYIKLRATLFGDKDHSKFEKICVDALEADHHKNDKIQVAEKLHKKLVKLGSSGENFKAKAAQNFIYAK